MENVAEAVKTNDVEMVVSGEESKMDEIDVDAKGVYKPKAPENAPVVISWEKLTVSTKPRNGVMKTLLKGVQGSITGGLWAIMGPSGSGKTTFLSCLSQRLDTQRMTETGSIVINGKPYDKALLKSMSGYVMQDDLLHAMLTVRETISYAASLRMGLKFTKEEREKRCSEVLETMGIVYCSDVIVGDSRNKGISGGERKRLCIAIELLTRPKLLFLDEPTSGLDSSTALSCMETLKKLADSGECTVVATLHQPQSKIYHMFDSLLLMKKGNIVYQGSAAMATEYFAKSGYPCPELTNPADHLLDVITLGDTKDTTEASVKRLTPFINLDFGLEKDDFTKRAINPWLFQFWILASRTFKEKFRRWDIFLLNVFSSCLVGVFVGCGSWYQIGNMQDSVSKRNPILFFAVIHQGVVSTLQGTYSFPTERAIMLRERASGSYYVSAYFLAKSTVELFFQLPAPMIYAAFTVPLTGLQSSGPKFCTYMMFCMFLSVSATSLANLMSCICVSIEMSTVALAMIMELTRLYSAFFVSPMQLDNLAGGKWDFIDALSYMKWCYVGLALNEYSDLKLSCQTSPTKTALLNEPKFVDTGFYLKTTTGYSTTLTAYTGVYGALGGSVCTPTGGPVIKAFGYDSHGYTIGYLSGILCVYIFGCRLFSYLALRFIKV